jgi:hypothetical protein
MLKVRYRLKSMAKSRRVERQEDDDEDDEEADVSNKMLFTGVMEGNFDVCRAALELATAVQLDLLRSERCRLFDDPALVRWNVAEQVKYCLPPCTPPPNLTIRLSRFSLWPAARVKATEIAALLIDRCGTNTANGEGFETAMISSARAPRSLRFDTTMWKCTTCC